MKEFLIVASRGRNPENPSERSRSDGKYRQRLEPNSLGLSNTLTGVQKDNLVLEIEYGCSTDTKETD
jgi:DNA (cytosine-5)-methyltransferase 1